MPIPHSAFSISLRRLCAPKRCFHAGLLSFSLLVISQNAPANDPWHSTSLAGVVDLGATTGDQPDSWRRQGYGFSDTDDSALNADAQLAINLALGGSTRAFIQGQWITYNGDHDDANPGLVQAFLEQKWQPAAATITLRAGQFFLPSSLENSNALWLAERTQTLSATNTWFAQEFRPIGAMLSVQPGATERNSFDLLLFQGNDAAGTQLAWRGWALGQRLSVTGEILPLGNIPSLSDNGNFRQQRNDGSTAFGKDLDHRPGYSLGWRGTVNNVSGRAYWVDTRGDRGLHQGEYAWDTRFIVAGTTWTPSPGWTLQLEAINGKSGMGKTTSNLRVDIDFTSLYGMASYQFEPFVMSLRYDWFEVVDRDFNPEDINNENGDGLTAALFWRRPHSPWRLGLEYVHASKERQALHPGRKIELRQLQMEARYYFQS